MRNANEQHSETRRNLEEEADLQAASKYLPTASDQPGKHALRVPVHKMQWGSVAHATRAQGPKSESRASNVM